MRIRMLTVLAGPGGCLDAGASADVPEEMALDLVLGGYAEALEPFPDSEPTAGPESPPAPDPGPEVTPEPAPEATPEAEPTPEAQPSNSKKKAK